MVVLIKVLTIWASFIPIAILNGALREKILVPLLGPRVALPLSALSGASLFFILTYLTLPWLGRVTPQGYLLIGVTWLGLTVSFEFTFGRLVAGKSWSELLRAYDLSTGNLWVLVLLVIAISPWCVARFRGL